MMPPQQTIEYRSADEALDPPPADGCCPPPNRPVRHHRYEHVRRHDMATTFDPVGTPAGGRSASRRLSSSTETGALFSDHATALRASVTGGRHKHRREHLVG
jgi:hypothetical protein